MAACAAVRVRRAPPPRGHHTGAATTQDRARPEGGRWAYGLAFMPWSPLGGGLLGGVLKKAQEGRRSSPEMQKTIEQLRAQLEAYERLRDEIGEQPADVALAWLLHNPVQTATIVGPRTPEQLAVSRRALDVTLAKLDEIWPGPGGEAPEAYAW
ncbi:aldo/keto reductase [Streptomyces sp. NPDC046979]|uniref:aldo/keto reductase n=1 Tax=Streptomyces sp. NPDC046979 TaxID=3154604 RepID=UPI0033F9F5B7